MKCCFDLGLKWRGARQGILEERLVAPPRHSHPSSLAFTHILVSHSIVGRPPSDRWSFRGHFSHRARVRAREDEDLPLFRVFWLHFDHEAELSCRQIKTIPQLRAADWIWDSALFR